MREMDFYKIQAEAKAGWHALIKSNRPHILIGTATCGKIAGAMSVLDAIHETLSKHKINASVTQVGCFGLCYAEPTLDIVKPDRPRICYGHMTPEKAVKAIEEYLVKDNPCPELALCTIGEGKIDGIPTFYELEMLKPQLRVALRNSGHINPERISHYIATGGYQALFNTLTKMTPQEVIDEVKNSGLRGRGGAGFPTGVKWQLCRNAEGSPKYMICNADEGDPGAFMDRSIMEGDPHSVIEGLIIAGYAIGANKAYIYIRAEYPLAVSRVKKAVSQARKDGFLGANIMNSGFDFDIEIKEGAGAFVCGEETALIASVEGKRGNPRPKPPFPAVSGVWGKPTTINNVKTLAMVPPIITNGANWYASIGTEDSKGTCIFALAGNINHMGLIEIPMGTPLHDVVYNIGGGIPKGKKLKAVQIGGPSGGCLPASLDDIPLEYASLIKAGTIMGSGGMVVMDESSCMVDVARHFLSFIKAESCGKCTPCRLGTTQMLKIMEGICEGKGKLKDIDTLLELGDSVKKSSLCALGGTAPNPVLTTLKYFREEYEEHIKNKRCPAGVCKALITYKIVNDKCNGCRACIKKCSADAITFVAKKEPVILDEEKCNRCGVCYEVCKFDAIEIV